MENALYYTLSTIAQTLAGALAVLVAIVLFKLSALATAIETGKNALRSEGIDLTTYWPIMRDQGYEALADRLMEDSRTDIRRTVRLRRNASASRSHRPSDSARRASCSRSRRRACRDAGERPPSNAARVVGAALRPHSERADWRARPASGAPAGPPSPGDGLEAEALSRAQLLAAGAWPALGRPPVVLRRDESEALSRDRVAAEAGPTLERPSAVSRRDGSEALSLERAGPGAQPAVGWPPAASRCDGPEVEALPRDPLAAGARPATG